MWCGEPHQLGLKRIIDVPQLECAEADLPAIVRGRAQRDILARIGLLRGELEVRAQCYQSSRSVRYQSSRSVQCCLGVLLTVQAVYLDMRHIVLVVSRDQHKVSPHLENSR
jgi:hypothetical protein